MKLWKVLARTSHVYSSHVNKNSQLEMYEFKSGSPTFSDDSGRNSTSTSDSTQHLATVQLRKRSGESLGIVLTPASFGMCRYCRATMNDLAELLCTRSSPCSECQAKNKFSCSKLMLSKQAQTQQKDECCCDSSGASAIPYTLRALDSEEESCPFICGKCMQPRMHPPCPCTNIKSEVIQTEKDKPKWNLDNSNNKPKKKPLAKNKNKKIKKKNVQIITKKKKKVKKVAKPKKVKKKENKQTKIPKKTKKTKKKVPKKEFQMPKVKPRDSIPLYAFKHPLSHRSLDMCSSNCKNNCTNCSLDLNQNSSSFSPIANTNLPCIKCNAGLLNRAHIMQCKLNSLEASLVQAKMAATSYEVRHMVQKSEPNPFNLHKQQIDEVNENEEN